MQNIQGKNKEKGEKNKTKQLREKAQALRGRCEVIRITGVERSLMKYPEHLCCYRKRLYFTGISLVGGIRMELCSVFLSTKVLAT